MKLERLWTARNVARLSMAVGALLYLATAFAADCEPWSLNGYRVGMTADEVEAVRPTGPPSKFMAKATGKIRDGKSARTATLSDGTTGDLLFDAEGRLLSWTREVRTPIVDQVSVELKDRFGVPEIDEPYKKTWIARDCDTMIVLGHLPSPRVSVVGFQRYSTYKAIATETLK